MTVDFLELSLEDIAAGVRAGERTAVEVTQHALERIDALNGRINAFVAVDADAALEAARAVDDQVRAGEDPGPLAGVPLGVKDLEDAAGFPTTKGCPVFSGADPAEGDSVLVARLKEAGCVVVGKTNTPELGWKGDTENPVFGATRNPWSLDHSPGGSSGGAAAAVASGMVPLATASDGGGSIRIPAALCGLPGFKPSLGRVPSGGGHAPDWHHLSTKGVLASTMGDTCLALDAIIGPDPTDLRSLPMPEPSWQAAIEAPHMPMKVAWSPTLGYADVDAEVLRVCEAAVGRFQSLGATVVELDGVFDTDPVNAWLTLTGAYHARTLAPFRGTEAYQRIDPVLRMLAERGAEISPVELVRAEDACHELNLRLVEVFHDVRLLVTPTTAAPPPRSGKGGVVNGAETPNWVAFTYPFNLTRSPAGSVPVGLTSAGLPVGLQMVGPQHGDLVVLRAMAALEAALDRPGRPAVS